MWDRRKLLLAAIVFTAFYYKVTVESVKLLDMAPNAVDDMYSGCRKEAMEKFIHSGLLQQEQNGNKEFQKAWSENTHCSKLIPGKIKEHTTALLAYANGDEDFKRTFGNAVEKLGVNVSIYEDHFHFKSLHFLLMDSMTLLNPKKCKTMYAVPVKKYTAKKGSKVRLGRFTVVSSSYSEEINLEDMMDLVILNITSCFFFNLGDNICSDTDMALLSPAEVFTVEEIRRRRNENDDEYTEIFLKHSRLDSYHNCYIFSRARADVSTLWLVLVLAALFLFFFNC